MTQSTRTSILPIRGQTWQLWLPQLLVFLYLLFALTLFVLVPVRAIEQMNGSSGNYFYIPYFIGIVYLGSALGLFFTHGVKSAVRTYIIFAASVGLVCAGFFDLNSTQELSNFWLMALCLAAASLINLAFFVPREDPIVTRQPFLRWASYALAAIIYLSVTIQMIINKTSVFSTIGWQVILLYVGLAYIFSLLWLSLRRMKEATPDEKGQLRLFIFGLLVSFGPVAIWFLVSPRLFPGLSFTPFPFLTLLIFPLTSIYTIQRNRLLHTDFVFSSAILFGLMGVLVTVGYAMLVSGFSLIFNGFLNPTNPIYVGLIVFLIAILIMPIRQYLENVLDTLFFRGRRVYQGKLQTFSGELTNLVEISGIIRILRQYIENSLRPERLHIYVFDPLTDQYVATPDSHGKLTSDLRFSTNNALVKVLSKRKESLILMDFDHLQPELQSDQIRIVLLGTQVFIPLPGPRRLAGWLALDRRISGEPYSNQEVDFMEALSDQAALAIERAQVVVNLENRVREMNVLTRIAQGINITLSLDDILELIYAQTIQLLPADDFHILMLDRISGALVEIFDVEENERLTQLENKPIPSRQSLEMEVLQQGRSILTDDFNQECQKRNIITKKANLYAWIGVPLNAGAETIGTLSLGKRDASINYTNEQLNLLQAIADQAAGAIIKARLLQESEQRTHQLATLNDMGRQLTSTLDLEPLLKNILHSATEILNCEAGSLLLVDEQTEELVFRVTVGPVAEDLINHRLPPGSGMVGKAVKNRAPVIVNDVQSSAEWFSKTDKQTGYVTRALLVVPLQVKENVIGVIEVLNKRDGSSFLQEDEDLLAAFASQAAIAIDNARLYTLTDRALAERVEELSVMQRIDRELNTSLDISQAMNITLEWAMRQSSMNAGLVGAAQADGIRVMASQGYTDELAAFQDGLIPLNAIEMGEAIDHGIPMRRSVRENGKSGLLDNGLSHIILPIRRETTTVGLILLESISPDPCSDDMLNFLMRLADHAAIAISNAQLYAAVQSANIAKSEFVSFVSHELKNPMTSIKGYTELLAAGAVGPINDAQANFLSTIRSNVERMATLVSDLADVSRIEAGRLKLDFKALNLKEIIDEISRSMRRQIEEKNQQLHVELAEDIPMVWADRTRLTQILTNLISNAAKYTLAEGQMVVAAEVCPNQWDPIGAPKVVHIWVKDTGIGISIQDQTKIFQKFFRSEDPKTREAPGTGLGLNITKSLVEMQGGKIWFESEFRTGTTFHFTVPISE